MSNRNQYKGNQTSTQPEISNRCQTGTRAKVTRLVLNLKYQTCQTGTRAKVTRLVLNLKYKTDVKQEAVQR